MVESAREFDFLYHRKYGDLKNKRLFSLGKSCGTLSRGICLFRQNIYPHYSIAIQVAIQTSEGWYLGHGSHFLRQMLKGLT